MSNPHLNPEQKRAAEAPEKPLLIVAGAGTGKTRTLMARLIHLLKTGASPRSICAITFTNKAAEEMKKRIELGIKNNELNSSAGEKSPIIHNSKFIIPKNMPFIGTFHSLGARILRAEARFAGRKPNFVIFDDHDSFDLIKKILKNRGEKSREGKPGFFAHAISEIKSGTRSPGDLAASEREAGRLIPDFFKAYEDALQKNNTFDFDDLIQKVVSVLKTNPAMQAKYNRRFAHVLVDEYQDVNNMQYELIRLLARGAKTVSVVGDDAQTIYGWRGSNLEIFLNFERDWPGAGVVLLEENYRSSSNIIEAASAVVAHNLRQKPKTLWTKNPAGPPVTMLEARGDEEEAAWIVEQIANSIAQSTKRTDGRFALSDSRFAVLYRTNAQSRAIEEALLLREIPYRIFGGIKFYERREIKDIIAALRTAQNPDDELSRERLRKAFRARVAADVETAMQKTRDAAAPAQIDVFLKTANYFDYLEKDFPNPEERRENIAELIHLATQFSGTAEFLERVSLLQATDKPDIRHQTSDIRNEINLMTIHMAKGLEFTRVFLAGCVEGILPHGRSMDTPEEVEEERRLMYVGMTRAREELSLSFYGQPSRFLSEIPTEFVEFKSLISDQNIFEDNEERYITLD